MARKLIGKFLVRRSTTHDGKEVLILCGSFLPVNFKVTDVSNADEMWVANITVEDGGTKFIDCQNGRDGGSPEEFLEGANQRPEDWKTKEKL